MLCRNCGKKMRVPDLKRTATRRKQRETAELLAADVLEETKRDLDGSGQQPALPADSARESRDEQAKPEPPETQVEQTAPAGQVERVEPGEPVVKDSPDEQMEHAEPVAPAGQVEPIEPAAPAAEDSPDEQVEHAGPVERVEPVEPVEPAEQVDPPEPVEPEPVRVEHVPDVQEQLSAARAYAAWAAGAVLAAGFDAPGKPAPPPQGPIEATTADLTAEADEAACEPDSPDREPAPVADDAQGPSLRLVARSVDAEDAEPDDDGGRWAGDVPAFAEAEAARVAEAMAAAGAEGIASGESDDEPVSPAPSAEVRGVRVVPQTIPREPGASPGEALSAFEASWREQVSRAKAIRREYMADRGVDVYSSWDVDEEDPLLCWEARRYDADPPCEDCQDRDGTIRKASEWRALGVPGAGLTACGHACRCSLTFDPELNEEDYWTGTIGFALRPSGADCRKADPHWDRELIRVTPETVVGTILDRWEDLRRARSVQWDRLEDQMDTMCGRSPERHLVHALRVALEGLRATRPETLARRWEIVNDVAGGEALASAAGSPHRDRVVELLDGAYLARASEMMQETMAEAAAAARKNKTGRAACWKEAKEIIAAAAGEFTLELPGLSECVGKYVAKCDRNARRAGR